VDLKYSVFSVLYGKFIAHYFEEEEILWILWYC